MAARRARTAIRYWFRIDGTPVGGAPEEVRRQWDGVLVPVREPRPVEAPVGFRTREVVTLRRGVVDDGVPVLVDDALRALTLFDRPARTWWEAYVASAPPFDRMVFRLHEGRLLPPPVAERLFPQLADFDTVD